MSIIAAEAPQISILRVGEVTKGAGVLDSWFIRASWPYKKEFLLNGLNLLDKDSLELVVLVLGPPTKEFYYSICSFTNLVGDIIPLDDNRQMLKETLDKYRKLDLEWLASLSSLQTANILIGLTELSGNALKFKLYEKALQILGQLQTQVASLTKVLKSSHKKGGKEDNELAREEVNKSSKAYLTYKKRLDEYEEFIDKLKNKYPKNEQIVKKNKNNKKKVDDSNEGIDFIQLLPTWINRKIFMYLDDESLSKCQKINFYWKYAISKLQLERKVREKIDIAKSEMEIVDLPGVASNESKEEKSIKSFKQEKKKKKHIRKTEEIYSSSEEFFERDLMDNKHWLEMIDKFKHAKDRSTFRKKHLLAWTLNEYSEARAVALGKHWFAMSRSNNIAICNLATFAIMPGCLKEHTSEVISMVFHPDDGQMVSIAKDQMLRRWDIWSRREVYNIKLSTPLFVVANNKYYAVAGTNIKVFCWEKNVCRWTLELENESIPISLCISSDDIIFVCIQPALIKMLDANTGLLIKEFSHSKLTCMYQFDKYLAAGNEEGWVTIWNVTTSPPIKLTRRNFTKAVRGVILHEGCIMAAMHDGILHIWDVAKNEIVRSTVINADTMPIINIAMLNYEDHYKLIINTVMGIKILQFDRKMKNDKIKKKQGFQTPQTTLVITPGLEPCIGASDLIKMRDRRKDRDTKFREELMTRHCCHPNLRKSINKIVTIKESVDNLGHELGELVYFPRFKKKKEVKVEKNRKEKVQEVEKNKLGKVVEPISYKTFLPIYNPYKQQF